MSPHRIRYLRPHHNNTAYRGNEYIAKSEGVSGEPLHRWSLVDERKVLFSLLDRGPQCSELQVFTLTYIHACIRAATVIRLTAGKGSLPLQNYTWGVSAVTFCCCRRSSYSGASLCAAAGSGSYTIRHLYALLCARVSSKPSARAVPAFVTAS